MDYQNVEAVGMQIAQDGDRIWVCVDGACVLRVRGIKTLELQDGRADIVALRTGGPGNPDELLIPADQ